MPAATDLALLMALRVRGRADATAVARAAGCSDADAAAALARAAARGAAAPVAPLPNGSAGLMTLTDAGRAELTSLLAAESLDRTALAARYARFLEVDRDLKQAITTWQFADEAGKLPAQDAVMAVAAVAGGVASSLAQIAERLAQYPARIAVAAGAIATGDARFVASPRVDSLHQVWFELHEDLLVTLGRSRAA
jgi:hypothetical protein